MQRILEGLMEKPVGPYTPAIQVAGWIFVSSQMGTDNGVMREGVSEQTLQALRNVEKVLRAAGAGRTALSKVTVFLKRITDYEEMNAAYREFFEGNYPARSTIGGVELPRGALVEVDAIACAAEGK